MSRINKKKTERGIKKSMKMERKIMVVGLVCLLISIALGAAIGTRTITDDSDSIYGQIIAGQNTFPPTAAGLTSAFAVGGDISIPKCNITFVSPLSPVAGSTIHGVGNGTIFYLAAASNCNMIEITTGNVSISGIYFNMNNFSQTYGAYSAIYLSTGAWDTIVRDCTFVHGVWHLINTISSSAQGRHIIEDNRFYSKQRQGYGGAVCMRGAKNIVRNNIIKDTWANGVCIEGSEANTYDNIVDGNIISGAISVGVYNEHSWSKNTTIVNNIISNINSTAYKASNDWYSIGIISVKGCIVSNNQIYGIGDIGIRATGNSTITGNTIHNIRYNSDYAGDGSGSGIVVSGDPYQKKFTIVSDNKIGYTMGTGIILSSNASVSGCLIKNVTGANMRGITVYGSGTVAFIDTCRIENIASSYGIQVDGSYVKAYISNCVITNVGLSGINIGTSRGGFIEGNMIEKTGSNGITVSSLASRYVINNNWINYTNAGSSDGMNIDGSNITVTGNLIMNGDEAIELDAPASNVSVTGNRGYLCNSGFMEVGACKYNSAMGNNFLGCTVPYTIVGTNSWAMWINGTTGTICMTIASGTIWK
jgi:hypothetical protein